MSKLNTFVREGGGAMGDYCPSLHLFIHLFCKENYIYGDRDIKSNEIHTNIM